MSAKWDDNVPDAIMLSNPFKFEENTFCDAGSLLDVVQLKLIAILPRRAKRVAHTWSPAIVGAPTVNF